jgi:hypothetical protein
MDIDALRDVIGYEPETGLLFWAKDRRKVKAGAQAGSLSHYGYIDVRVFKKLLKAHRIAWALTHGQWPDAQIDHINGVRTDNRLCNLRLASNAENRRNSGKQKANTSGFKGVTWSKSARKWMAQITKDGKNNYLGLFSDPTVAHAAYAKAAHSLHGEFARVS